MHAGLTRILDLIRVNPQDTLLVDRFLILASDLNEEERADVTLSLSEALLRKNPRRAVELAHMVYKVRPYETEPIELMVEGLENLGRYGKATVLRQHLDKVRKAKDTNPGQVQKAVEDSMAAIDRELLLLSNSPSAEPKKAQSAKLNVPLVASAETPSERIDIKPVASPSPRIEAPPVPASSSPKKIFDVPSVDVGVALFQLEPEIPTPVGAMIAENPKIEAPIFNLGASIQDSDQDISVVFPETKENRSPAPAQSQELTHDNPDSSVDPTRAPGVPAYRMSSKSSEGVPSLIESDMHREGDSDPSESDDFQSSTRASRHSFLSRGEAVEVTRVNAEPASTGTLLEDFRSYLSSENWEGAWRLIDLYWKSGTTGEVAAIAKQAHLYKLDLRFTSWWMDCLILDRRPRQALVLGIRTLQLEPNLNIARVLFPKLEACHRVLGLRSLEWQDGQGVLALLRSLRDEQAGALAPVAILNVSKTA